MEHVRIHHALLRCFSCATRIEKKMFRPAEIKHFAVIVYETPSRFSRDLAQDMINGLITAARDVG
jgi:hypothetical protein